MCNGSLDISSGAWEVPIKFLKEVTDATKNEPPPDTKISDAVSEMTAANAHRRIDKLIIELDEIKSLLKKNIMIILVKKKRFASVCFTKRRFQTCKENDRGVLTQISANFICGKSIEMFRK